MSDDALIEEIARAINPECFEKDVVATYGDLWAFKQQDRERTRARAALAVARKAILEEAARACAGELLSDPSEGDEADEAYDMAVRDCEAAIRALAEQERV